LYEYEGAFIVGNLSYTVPIDNNTGIVFVQMNPRYLLYILVFCEELLDKRGLDFSEIV